MPNRNFMQYGTDFGAMWFREERCYFKEKESVDERQTKFYTVWYGMTGQCDSVSKDVISKKRKVWMNAKQILCVWY